MKRNVFLFLFSIAFLLNACNNTNTSQKIITTDSATAKKDTCNFQIDESKWLILNNNGQGNEASNFKQKAAYSILDNYVNNLKTIDEYSIEIAPNYPKHFDNDSLSIDSVGQWEDYVVFQVSNFYIMHRSVLLKDCRGNFRILYCEFDHVGSPSAGIQVFPENADGNPKPLSTAEMRKELLPVISAVNGNNELIIKAFLGGNKEYYERYHYIIQTENHLPMLVK